MANLARILTETAGKHGERPAVRLDDDTMSYAQLDEAVSRCAGMLKAAGAWVGLHEATASRRLREISRRMEFLRD